MSTTSIKRVLKTTLKVVGGIVLGLLIVSLFVFGPLDREEYKGKPFYTKTFQLIDSLPSIKTKGQLKAGWAKASIIPSNPLPIASYGIRKDYEGVHDTVWCRAFVLDNGIQRSAIVTLDILIFPPEVLERVISQLPIDGITENNLYVSTSHTHNGPGGWAKGLGGRILAGPYNEEYVTQLTNTILATIREAKSNLSNASIGFGKSDAAEVVYNRFTDNKEDLDYWLRTIKIKKENGQVACIVSFAGHTNILSSKFNELSADYAGALVNSLEGNSKVDFAAFISGAVATHTCRHGALENWQLVDKVSSLLYNNTISQLESIPMESSITISSLKFPIYLREPQLKVGQLLKVRPWVFNKLFGEQEIFISELRLGNILMIGTPCDFGGGLSAHLSKEAEKKNLHLMITSFNGGYVGYILPDEYYDLDMREPRDMDWFGPYSGSYFYKIIQKRIEKNSKF